MENDRLAILEVKRIEREEDEDGIHACRFMKKILAQLQVVKQMAVSGIIVVR